MTNTGWLDIHTHILPKIDDGSSSVIETQEMIHMEEEQGVEQIVATPHFYPNKESPKEFLKRRETSVDMLDKTVKNKIKLGAEVTYYTGIGNSADLSQLCIEGTNLLLLEMPIGPWNQRILTDVINISHNLSLQVIIAHIDRYIFKQNKKSILSLMDLPVLFQVNTSAFEKAKTRKFAIDLLINGRMDFIGSDCHNLDSRKPDFNRAKELMTATIGEKCVKEWISMNYRKYNGKIV